MIRRFEETLGRGTVPIGTVFEDWFGIDHFPDHVTGGAQPDERVPDSDSAPPSDSPTIPASDFDILYNRALQFTHGRDLPNWTPSSLEEVTGVWRPWAPVWHAARAPRIRASRSTRSTAGVTSQRAQDSTLRRNSPADSRSDSRCWRRNSPADSWPRPGRGRGNPPSGHRRQSSTDHYRTTNY